VLPGQPPDHLGPAAGLPAGPLNEVGVADAVPVLACEPQACEPQEGRQLRQRVEQTAHSSRVAVLVAAGEVKGALAGLGDRRIAGRVLDVVEDGPARGLDVAWMCLGTLASTLQARWTRDRWRSDRGNARSFLRQPPLPPRPFSKRPQPVSESTSRNHCCPRVVRPRAAQDSWSGCSPVHPSMHRSS
jgi:hypothetical protein